ncbi:MAG: hypothetical protein WAN30_02080 [Acidimicrobiales bacterium]
MTATLSLDDELDTPHVRWRPSVPALLAVGGFAVFVILVLTKATALLEPDDYAYRASIVALSHGHILLTNAQYEALNRQLAASGGQGILQWHHLASGKWISEKNPGYPFFAVLFYLLGILRVTPLFYGALACVGLYAGAKAWAGRWAGTYAVWLYCFSGAAITFAWRDTMPSFTDASLIAAGFGALLWTMLTTSAPPRRRLVIGLLGFLALEGAVFIRYTNVIELAVAALGVIVVAKASLVPWRTVGVWLGSVVLFGLGVLAFDQWAYGRATSTGYSPGEISFSLSALWPNLRGMPKQLTTSMPFWLLAGATCVFVTVRYLRSRSDQDLNNERRVRDRRDALVTLLLAAGWLGLWFLYLTYTWTVNQVGGPGRGAGPGGGVTVHVIRFYLPALGIIALLGAWLLVRLGRYVAWAALGVLVLAGVLSFHSMASSGSLGAGPNGGFPVAHSSQLPLGHGGPRPTSSPPGTRNESGGPGSGAPPSGTFYGPPPTSGSSAG